MMKIKYSADGNCMFDPVWNSFQLKNGKRLRSWRKIIKQFTEQVDSNELAVKYVAKHGGTVAETLAKWKDKADNSRKRGIAIHGYFDEYATTGKLPIALTAQETVARQFMEQFFITGRLTPIASEIIAYSEEHNCATLIDNISQAADGNKYIIDWKTDEVIKTNNYGRRMKPPFNFLPDHDLQKHSLQLNFCKALCTDHKIDGMFIGHIGPEGHTLIPVEDINLNLAAFA